MKNQQKWLICLLISLIWCLDSRGQEKNNQQDADRQEIEKIRKAISTAGQAAKKKDFAGAIKQYSSILKDYPKYSETLLLRRANAYFSNGQIKSAIADYDKLIELNKSVKPYLWQRGLALYYAERFADGQKQFEVHQTVNSNDVENAVWHFLCVARHKGLKTAKEKLIPIEGDTRVPMKQVHDLFSGKGTTADVIKAAKQANSKSALYYAHLYVGLFEEVSNDQKSSLKSMKRANEIVPFSADVLMGQIARIHLQLRQKKPQKSGQRTKAKTDKR